MRIANRLVLGKPCDSCTTARPAEATRAVIAEIGLTAVPLPVSKSKSCLLRLAGLEQGTSPPLPIRAPVSLQPPATAPRRRSCLDPGTATSFALPNLTCHSSPRDRDLIPPQRSSSSQIRPPHPTTSPAGGGWTRCRMSSATVEEQMVVKAIREECPWESLPKRLQATLQTKEEWHRR